MRTLFFLSLMAFPSFSHDGINLEAYTPDRKPTFDSILRRAQARFPDCLTAARKLSAEAVNVVPVAYACNPHEKTSRIFVYEVEDKTGLVLGTLEVGAGKHPMMKMLSLKSCDVFPR